MKCVLKCVRVVAGPVAFVNGRQTVADLFGITDNTHLDTGVFELLCNDTAFCDGQVARHVFTG